MSISDINKINKQTIIIYAIATIFMPIFAIIYYQFSHHVYSDFMTYAFIYPLFGLLLYIFHYVKKIYSKWPYNFINAGIATITVASILQAVNEISGADTTYHIYFYIVGISFVFLSFVTEMIINIRGMKK